MSAIHIGVDNQIVVGDNPTGYIVVQKADVTLVQDADGKRVPMPDARYLLAEGKAGFGWFSFTQFKIDFRAATGL